MGAQLARRFSKTVPDTVSHRDNYFVLCFTLRRFYCYLSSMYNDIIIVFHLVRCVDNIIVAVKNTWAATNGCTE